MPSLQPLTVTRFTTICSIFSSVVVRPVLLQSIPAPCDVVAPVFDTPLPSTDRPDSSTHPLSRTVIPSPSPHRNFGLVEVHILQHIPNSLLRERPLPVFQLGIARKQQLLPVHLEQQNQAGVIEELVEDGHDGQSVLLGGGLGVFDEPARL